MDQKKILIAAGGTGGHIVPALTLGEDLKNHDIKVEFVHGGGALEKELYAKAGFPSHLLRIGRLRKNVHLKERITTLLCLPLVLLKAMWLILKIKPTVVLGFGGSVSGPLLLAGSVLRKKIILFEPNALPGMTHRLLADFVDLSLVVFDSAKKYFKNHLQVTYPVRPKIACICLKKTFHPPLKVLVIGGSQGSSLINKVVSSFIYTHLNTGEHNLDKNRDTNIVHQTGIKEFAHYEKLYQGFKQHVRVFSFLHNIHEFYEWADVVISRAGAGARAEIVSAKRASVLVPLASSADQHQLKNAKNLEQKSLALVIEEKDFNKESLNKALTQIRQKDFFRKNFVSEQSSKVPTLCNAIRQIIEE